MLASVASSPQAPEPAVLLVLLPMATEAAGTVSLPSLALIQQQLGTAVRVLKIDEATHPTVVRSFQATELPAFVLVRQGVELWRQQGLPEGETIASLLLRKISAANGSA